MKSLFRRPSSPAVRLLLLTVSGFAFGLLMSQLDVAARQVGLFVESMDFVHRPAFFLAEIIHTISHSIGDPIRSFLDLEKPNTVPPPNVLFVDFGSLRCIPYGIVFQWTLVGALIAVAWNVWRFAGWRRRFRCNIAKALRTAVGLGLLVGNVQATNRYFEDLGATSPNGRFRVEAKSPDNVDGAWKRPFQGKFVYRLLEKGKSDDVWTRNQPTNQGGSLPLEGPPVALYVSNNGWVIIRTADLGTACELVAVDPSGQDKLRVDILKALVPDKEAFVQYVSVGSAGVRWGEAYCHPYFLPLHTKPHFCLTTWWGKRLLLDLSAGRIITDLSEFEPELAKAEKVFVLATWEPTSGWKYNLEDRINPGFAEASPGPHVGEVIAALLMAAKLKMQEAVPSVRKLESCPVVSSTTGGISDYEAPVGGIKPAVYQNLAVRQAAQLCLRRLGLRPSTHQSTRIYRGGHYWQPEDPLPFQREKGAKDLMVGMEPEQVTALIGVPDFIVHKGWEYDLDGDSATLVIHWGPGGCEKIEKQMPPKWRNGVERDVQLVH